MIDRAGPLVSVWLRLAFGAALLAILRPAWRSRPGGAAWRAAILFGVVLAGMNASFYVAISRIPLGVAVTIEFWGPLAVAILASRRPLDLLWAVLAGAGILVLADGRMAADDSLGVFFALLAGLCWVVYILQGTRLGREWPDGRGLGAAMLVGAALLLPLAVLGGPSGLLDPWVLGAGLVVATFSSVIPYTLELAALRRLRPGTYGVLTSLEPAIAALVGLAFLGQGLGPADLLGIAFVVTASAGASLAAMRRRRSALPEEGLVVAD
jgi:inner membrane transporter RhtA